MFDAEPAPAPLVPRAHMLLQDRNSGAVAGLIAEWVERIVAAGTGA